MPIVGFHIDSISAKRMNSPRGRIDINSTPHIISVDETKVGFGNKENSLNVGFQFVTRYEPEVGEIKINGHVVYLGKKMKSGLKTWKREKRLPKEIEIEVKNFLFRKCMIIGITLSEDMHLPPPLMFPHVTPKKSLKKKEDVDMRYIG